MAINNELLLSVQDLKVYFRGDETLARAVDGVSYEVHKGETVCLVGESGCGKTVSALAILGIIPRPPGEIAGGAILFNSTDLLTLEEDALQEIRGNHIAMVFQEPMTSLNPVFTIGDQIEEAIMIHEDLDEEERRDRAVQLLKDVGIPSPEERLGDYPHQLSGGQRQRVMIAMALACGPDLVIADEPTTALDVTIQSPRPRRRGQYRRSDLRHVRRHYSRARKHLSHLRRCPPSLHSGPAGVPSQPCQTGWRAP